MQIAAVKSGKVVRWGNSAAVRIPAAALSAANLSIAEDIEIEAHDGELVIRRVPPRVSMAELLARFDPAKHRHELMLDDVPVGAESI